MNIQPVKLTDLLELVPHSSVIGPVEGVLTGCTCDSREVREGDLFAALKGFNTDGRNFVPEAFSRGAGAVLSHAGPESSLPDGKTWIVSPRDREAFSAAAAAIYDPGESIPKLVGVTGTNGKTTVAYLLRSILGGSGRAGMLGTIEYDDGEGLKPAWRTTPEANHIHSWLRSLANRSIGYGVMEVSSHALVLSRVNDLRFRVAAFTNLTRDHLDFHRTMDDYYRAKLHLFSLMEEDGTAVINIDDSFGKRMVSEIRVPNVVTLGSDPSSDVHPIDVVMGLDGTKGRIATPWGEVEIDSPLMGEFNLQNIMTASASALSAGASIEEVYSGVKELALVPGRIERVEAGQPFTVVVDFAHTDDALKQILSTLRSLEPDRIITVFGCGGDRDASKRPLMGTVVSRLSDCIVLTSDNPRGEDPELIADMVETGIRPELSGSKEFLRVLDRREAIRTAIEIARAGDLILIAGKGHERTQLEGDRKRPFHDPTVAGELLREKKWGN